MEREETNKEAEIPDGLISVGQYPTFKMANDHALVILSMRLPYWMFEHSGIYYLCVEKDAGDAVGEQLETFDRESYFWPPKLPPFPKARPASPSALAFYSFTLIGFFLLQCYGPPAFERSGVMDGVAVFSEGQWARAITALTLHADAGHLIANLFSGLCFGLLVNRTLGAGLGWLLIVLSGFGGNLITGATYFPHPHLSLGASTAIFGALGLLVGHAIAFKFAPVQRPEVKYRLVPVFAGLMVLGWLGLGGGNPSVDVLAHVFGFGVGVPLGVLGALCLKTIKPHDGKQELCAILTVLIIMIAWAVQIQGD